VPARLPDALRRIPGGVVLAAVLLAAGPLHADEPPDPAPASWATSQAAELTRQGRAHAAHGEASLAIERYLAAVGFDATYGPAYLALASAYEAAGDVKEAERTYAVGIDHVPGFADALLGRGRLRAALHRMSEALADFEEAASLRPDAIGVLRELYGAYVAAGALPAALAVTRRIAVLADDQRDARAAAEARVGSKALALLVGDADPVTAGKTGRGEARRALWAWTRRR
jgi:tetratricopeptide (TPR) repeat protein